MRRSSGTVCLLMGPVQVAVMGCMKPRRLRKHFFSGLLDAPSAELWRPYLAEALVAAPALPIADLLAIMHAVALVDEEPANADVGNICVAFAAAPGPAIDAAVTVLAVLDGGHYVPALAQSAIFQAFGGAGGASGSIARADVWGRAAAALKGPIRGERAG